EPERAGEILHPHLAVREAPGVPRVGEAVAEDDETLERPLGSARLAGDEGGEHHAEEKLHGEGGRRASGPKLREDLAFREASTSRAGPRREDGRSAARRARPSASETRSPPRSS